MMGFGLFLFFFVFYDFGKPISANPPSVFKVPLPLKLFFNLLPLELKTGQKHLEVCFTSQNRLDSEIAAEPLNQFLGYKKSESDPVLV